MTPLHASPKSERYPFSPFPNGWYAVAWSHELAPGQVRGATYMGRRLVLFRTQQGRAVLADAFCPHLGADLGVTGRVVGEQLQCRFHGFCFEASGRCTRAYDQGKVPPTAQLGVYPTREWMGVIIAWFHHLGQAPDWEVPVPDLTDWSPLLADTAELRTHPQETSENSVDIGHFATVHAYRDVAMLRDVAADGPTLTARYRMTRASFLGHWAPPIVSEFDVWVHGLGFSLVEVEVQGWGIRTRHVIMNTPIDGDRVHLRAGSAVHREFTPRLVSRLLSAVPTAPVHRLLRGLIQRSFLIDMRQDYAIWETKRYADRPALAAGDGPIGPYRRWARQFYPA